MDEAWPFRWGERTFVMGIVNVTPDSFSGDGVGRNPADAAALARSHQDGGADVVDIGGESTRPGSSRVPEAEELARVAPAIRAAAEIVSVPISVDTTRASIARRAIALGARLVNDISGLESDPEMVHTVQESAAGIVIMHGRRVRRFQHVVDDVLDFLSGATERATRAGIPVRGIIVDPGFGFAKRPEENLELLRRLRDLRTLGFPVLCGTSRKSTIGEVLDLPVDDRLEGTMATVALAIANGADMVRVHDVRVAVRVSRMTDAVVRGELHSEDASDRGVGTRGV